MTDRRPARWSNFFDDLVAQLENELGAEELDLHAEEERLRLGSLTVRDRLAGISALNLPVNLVLVDSRVARVRVSAIGQDWCAADLLDGAERSSQCVIPLASVAAIELDASGGAEIAASVGVASEKSTGLTERLTLSFVLRDFCRRRSAVRVVLRIGEAHGTIDRVGRDHFDLALHASDSPRRRDAVSGVRVIPFAELVMLRL